MTREEMKDVAEQASDEAIKKILLALGIDASTPDGVLAFQKDARFIRDLRESTEAVKRKTIMTLVGIVVAGFVGYVVLAFRQ